MNITQKIIYCFPLLLSGCHASFPSDPNNTLTEITQSKTIRIGICHQITDRERSLLENLANSLSAQIIWETGSQENLYRSLEQHKIAIVSCSINQETPWRERITLSKPYYNAMVNEHDVSYVFALQQGENRWAMYVNEFIKKNKDI